METPICNFVKKYIEQNNLRLHMPGHKGCGLLGFEQFDITEINGADSLYEASGVIKQSEENASGIFGCNTFYSTEGSTQCIKAMLYLATMGIKGKPLIAAGRNAHKAFVSAAALLDFDIDWLNNSENYLNCNITKEYLEDYFKAAKRLPTAVYITSPDYLGNILDLDSISKICKQYEVLLLVDNAHGAYLKFLPNSLHPMDLGADMCADSAHKTLPTLTGGAYLHISKGADAEFTKNAKNALLMFGSTSPSYLILQSLDRLNIYLSSYKNLINSYIAHIVKLKSDLKNLGFTIIGSEPLKITIATKSYGYTGFQICEILEKNKIVCEFCDPDFITLMFTPAISPKDLEKVLEVFKTISIANPIMENPPILTLPEVKISPRKACFSKCKTINVRESLGRVSAQTAGTCPPAVPIIVSGEEINSSVILALEYYKIKTINVIE